MSQWNLTKEEYNVLLSFIGYGNFPDADIIVYGNEEGLGGYGLEENIKARVRSFGRNEVDGSYINCINNTNWEEGFYEQSGANARKKIESFYNHSEKIKQPNVTKSDFNLALARISLSLELKNETDFFKLKDNYPNNEVRDLLNEFIINELYTPRNGIQTALADWRPLPRFSEKSKDWPQEYNLISSVVNKNPYLKAFNRPKEANNIVDRFSDYRHDVNKRLEILKNAFVNSKSKIILGIGGADGIKKASLERMFGEGIFETLLFDTVEMVNSQGNNLKSYKANISLNNKDLHIFLIPFPAAGQIFKTKQDALNMLKELTEKHLKPILK